MLYILALKEDALPYTVPVDPASSIPGWQQGS
jgi:hypothetical protein